VEAPVYLDYFFLIIRTLQQSNFAIIAIDIVFRRIRGHVIHPAALGTTAATGHPIHNQIRIQVQINHRIDLRADFSKSLIQIFRLT
jgi:hypothetical protein